MKVRYINLLIATTVLTMALSNVRTTVLAAVLPDPQNVQEQHHTNAVAHSDPLVATGWEHAVYIGVIVLAIIAVALVGVVSRKIEHVIMLAAFLSLVLVGVFFVVGH